MEFRERDRTEALLDYLEGRFTNQVRAEFRQKLSEDQRLRGDLYFLMQAKSEAGELKLCPSKDLLADYFFESEKLEKEVKDHIKAHFKECRNCRRVISEMEAVQRVTRQKRGEEEVEKPAIPQTTLALLRKVGRDYLPEEMLDSLFERLNQSISKKEDIELAPQGLGFSGDLSLSPKEKKFQEILSKLFSKREELNACLEEGNIEEFKTKLEKVLPKGEVEEMMDRLK